LRGSKGSLFEGGIKVDSFIYHPTAFASAIAASASIASTVDSADANADAVVNSEGASTGIVYSNLMHISDWAPTMLSLAGIEYKPDLRHEFDGVSHVTAWLDTPATSTSTSTSTATAMTSTTTTPRRHLLYNMYLDLTDANFDIWHNGSFAVRDSRFKLVHAYNDSKYGVWNDPFTAVDGDDDLEADERCAQQFLSGDFTVRSH
jgi:arylsulfatase A-like enzyme